MACNQPTDQQSSEHVDEARHNLIADNSPVFVSQEEANDMIQGYLSGIDYPANDTSLRSLLYNADSLRSYLSDTSIHQLKLMFAQDVSSDSHAAVSPACFGPGLTIVMVGVDANGDYRLYRGTQALNHGVPCPKNCMVSGSAAANTIVAQ
jgi:hypothetical protein